MKCTGQRPEKLHIVAGHYGEQGYFNPMALDVSYVRARISKREK